MEFKRQSATIKTDGVDDRKDWGVNGKVVLTHFTLKVLEEPIKDDASHQSWRKIHLYRDSTREKPWHQWKVYYKLKEQLNSLEKCLFKKLQTKSYIYSQRCGHISKSLTVKELKLHSQSSFGWCHTGNNGYNGSKWYYCFSKPWPNFRQSLCKLLFESLALQ